MCQSFMYPLVKGTSRMTELIQEGFKEWQKGMMQ